MAHEIETFADGTAAFFSARIVAWHKLGIVTPDCLTADDALRVAQLDWNVDLWPLQTFQDKDNPAPLDVPDFYATVRNHPKLGQQALGVVGSRYTVIQNQECFAWMSDLVDMGGAVFETAGSLYGGRKVFMTMKLPQHIGVVSDRDYTELYLLAQNAHDGSGAMRGYVTPVRAVCANTIRLATAQAVSSFSIRHTSGAKERLEEARRALRLTFEYVDAFEEEFAALLDKTYTDTMFEQLVKKLAPDAPKDAPKAQVTRLEARREELLGLWDAPTQAGIRGTGWGAYNAAVEWADWYSPVKGRDKDTIRARRQLEGGRDEFKNRALDLVRAA